MKEHEATTVPETHDFSYDYIFNLTSNVRPNVFRIAYKVLKEGFLVPRSAETTVLMPTPAKSASVC